MAEPKERPPYGYATIVGAVVFGIYLATLAPTTAFWDTSEYIAAAKALGIPHPPGNPLFIILAHGFGLLPLAASYAVRINLFAALTSALAAGLWFLVAERWLRTLVPDRLLRFGAAAAGVLVGSFSWTVWNQSTVNEKVYTVSLFFMALATWLAVHWGDDESGPHRDRWLVLIAYVTALTSTNHMMGVLAGPAIAVYVLWTDWRIITRPWAVVMGWFLFLAVTGGWQEILSVLLGPPGTVPEGLSTGSIVVLLVTLALLGWAALRDAKNPLLYLGIFAVVVGVSLNYLFLPIRAAQFPPINEGEPVGFMSRALNDVLNRVQYLKPSVFVKPWFPYEEPRTPDFFFSQLANYWQYFTWQFARDWPGMLRGLGTGVFAVTGLAGLWALLKKDRRAGVAAAAMLFTLTFALVFYLNFKYGYSIHPERTDIDPIAMREVRERDYFFMGSFAFFGTLVAAGLGAGAARMMDRFRTRLAGLPVLALGLVPFFGNRATASRAHEWIAHDFATDLLESVQPYGILITAGDNDTFPLWFAQEVERIRPDITLVNLSLANTDWHLRQIRRRVTPDFDPSRAFEVWKPRADSAAQAMGIPPDSWPKPPDPVISLTERELDSLPEISRVPKGSGVQFGEVQIAFGTEYMERRDLAIVFLIRDNLDKRPIYFSWSSAKYPDETLGLTPYLVTEGLVRRLNPKPVDPGGNLQFTNMGFTDMARTKTLLNAYHWQSATRERPRGWTDPPSASILLLYSLVYGLTADAFRAQGDSAFAARNDSIARRVQEEIGGSK
ncbi:MAG: glycosyltransferase family 117 protein [Gemmatimonadales bacterium]